MSLGARGAGGAEGEGVDGVGRGEAGGMGDGATVSLTMAAEMGRALLGRGSGGGRVDDMVEGALASSVTKREKWIEIQFS